jgi:tRNA dimethylallyltransferase
MVGELLAKRLGGEIVSADSMQVYPGMDIGTAKVSVDERRVPYHGIDLVEAGEEYSAALYQRDARSAIADIRTRGGLPVVVGGTGLYVSAALDDLKFPAGELASPLRAGLEADARTVGPEAMHARLEAEDPESAALIHPNNVRRTIRALEMAAEGLSYANQASGLKTRASVYNVAWFGLTMSRPRLYERIDARVEQMLRDGLLDEIAGLLDAGFRDALTAVQAIGYKEFVPVIESGGSIDEAKADVQTATRRYAKRQLTWFRRDTRIRWLDVGNLSPGQTAEALLGLLESGKTAPYPFADEHS